jgi:uncharacterized protein (DUF608 family)
MSIIKFLFIFSAIVLAMPSTTYPDSTEELLLNKNFSQEWIKDLCDKGIPRSYSGEELTYIGMPVGGLYAGQMYLSGDGRLWNWDIFNDRVMNPGGPGDKFYLKAMRPEDFMNVSSGFVVDYGEEAAQLNSSGFPDIRFRGEYPIAKVQFFDPKQPLKVELEAFSPYSPTEDDNSSIPAIILCYKATNRSDKPIHFRLGGWLENASNRKAVKAGTSIHTQEPILSDSGILLTAKATLQPTFHADTGSMALTLLGSQAQLITNAGAPESWLVAGAKIPDNAAKVQTRELTLEPGESTEVRFAVCWYFPNGHLGFHINKDVTRRKDQRHYYDKFYDSASDVAKDLSERHDQLVDKTRLWSDTWYDSTLPCWFLDRTFINASTLATAAAQRFHDTQNQDADGRVYFWEGVYLGIGTCTHVTHYEQAFGRLFPESARAQRRITDYNIGWNDRDGYTQYRAENKSGGTNFGIPYAIDGATGTILRTYREHATAVDNSFLRAIWPRVKRATQLLIDQDTGSGLFEKYVPEEDRNSSADGILTGLQYQTLDKTWDGIIPAFSGMYIAALKAAAEMADDMGDTTFAARCRQIAAIGPKNLTAATFEEDFGYFVQRPKDQNKYININNGCYIDQMLGDYWAHQAGLGPVFPKREGDSALKKIVENNLFSEVKDYQEKAMIKAVRHYALPDEPGTVICSFPHGGEREAIAGHKKGWNALVVGYFSESMTGFTYQAAANMISRGLVIEGLALCKAIDDRYAGSPTRRNPFNEIEYGNHYTRAMSSYGAFISMCGFTYHGPKGEIGFDPKMNAENFRSAFTAAEGWGTYSQVFLHNKMQATLAVKSGRLSLNSVHLNTHQLKVKHVQVTLNGKPLKATLGRKAKGVIVQLAKPSILTVGHELDILIQ